MNGWSSGGVGKAETASELYVYSFTCDPEEGQPLCVWTQVINGRTFVSTAIVRIGGALGDRSGCEDRANLIWQDTHDKPNT
jgi:hypothetical protein